MVFWWRKRNDGFEWRTYVRTTILVRRHERRQRAEDVKAAAVFGVKQAGAKGAGAAGSALKSAQSGSLAALKWSGRRLAVGAQKSAAGLASSARLGAAGARAGWVKGRAAVAPKFAAAGSAVNAAAARAAQKLEPATAPLRQPGILLALRLIAGVSAAGALIRARQFGFDGHALVALGVAAVTLLLLVVSGSLAGWWPGRVLRRAIDYMRDAVSSLPGLDRLTQRGTTIVILGAVTLAGTAAWMWHHGGLGMPHFVSSQGTSSTAPRVAASQETSSKEAGARDPDNLEGSASVQSGETLRLAGVTVRLAGIEAPDRLQSCAKPGGRRWDCAASARDALAKLVRGRRITCALSGQDESGIRTGQCNANGADLASELVRNGHVFAASGLFASYSTQEGEAQSAKAGLWAGDALRPAEWRAARWEEAKGKAPLGCPIKGQVYSKTRKVYMLPWSPDYDRARIDTAQGERWFCTESEAVSAGWKKGL